jgi:hypothetical protein
MTSPDHGSFQRIVINGRIWKIVYAVCSTQYKINLKVLHTTLLHTDKIVSEISFEHDVIGNQYVVLSNHNVANRQRCHNTTTQSRRNFAITTLPNVAAAMAVQTGFFCISF